VVSAASFFEDHTDRVMLEGFFTKLSNDYGKQNQPCETLNMTGLVATFDE